jgi:hypothetical protein
VFAGNAPLVRFLLDQGADPECKGGLAVLIAIRRKDMHTARTLIERDYVPPIASKKRKLKHAAFDVDDDPRSDVTASGGAKKRKLGDRVSVSKEMLRAAQESGAEDIVTYFISEKGCIPDIRTLTMMGSGSPRPAVSASTARRLAARKSNFALMPATMADDDIKTNRNGDDSPLPFFVLVLWLLSAGIMGGSRTRASAWT